MPAAAIRTATPSDPAIAPYCRVKQVPISRRLAGATAFPCIGRFSPPGFIARAPAAGRVPTREFHGA